MQNTFDRMLLLLFFSKVYISRNIFPLKIYNFTRTKPPICLLGYGIYNSVFSKAKGPDTKTTFNKLKNIWTGLDYHSSDPKFHFEIHQGLLA